MCTGYEAVWKDKPFYGQGCRCCFGADCRSCRRNSSSDGIFKFPGTLIKSSPHPQYISGIAPLTPTAVSSPTPFLDTPSLVLSPPSILFMSSPLFVSSRGEGQHHSSLEAQQGLQPLVRGCGVFRKADAAEMPKELKTIVSEDVNVTVDDNEVYGFTHGDDDVLPYTDTSEDTLISYLPIPVDGGGLCPRRGCSLSAGSRAATAMRGRCTRHGTWVHWQSKTMASLTLLLPLASPLLLPLFLLGARTRLLPFRLVAMMMVFFPLLTSQPVFLLILTSGDQDLPTSARVRLRRLLLHPYLVQRLRHLGRIPFPFLPFPLPLTRCLHLLLSSLPSSRLLHVVLPSFPPCPRFSRHFTLSFFTSVKSPSVGDLTVPCPILADIACHYVSLCRSLIHLSHPSSPTHTFLDS